MTRRAQEVLERLGDGPVIGAEIGVFAGKTSAVLLKREDLTLYMVDTWKGFQVYPGIVVATHEEQEKNYQAAMAATEFAAERRRVVKMPSVDAAEKIDDESLDFVFIDADHSYEAVTQDINAWTSKVRPGGLVSGHDYANPDYLFGAEVKRAVDEAVKKNGWKLELGGDYTWFVTR